MGADSEILTRCADGRTEVFDIVRRRYVACTPEEWVRQQVIHHLHKALDYPLGLMRVEGAISLNGLTKRCDVVIFRPGVGGLEPMMIVECKQPSVTIDQKVADQACRYNCVLHVPFLFLTNGRQQLCLQVDAEKQTLAQVALPSWNFLIGLP